MVAVGRIVERPFLVDDPDGRLVGHDFDFLDLADPLFDFGMEQDRRFDRRLRVKLGGKRDFEKYVLHHVGAVVSRELERFTLEEHVVKPPRLGAQNGRVAHFAGARDERQAHGAAGGVPRRPRFARTGVGRVAVGAQALPVDEGVGHRADDFVARETEHLRHHRRRRNFDEHHVIESDAIEAVLEGDDPLDLVGFDHGRQHLAHRARRFAAGDRGTREPIRGGEDGAQVVGGVAPLRGEPSIVEVEPANQRADVERRLHRIELKLGAGDASAIGHRRAGDDGSEQLGACRVLESLETAAERVHEAKARRVVGLGALDDVF